MHDLNDFKAVVGDLITLLEEFNEIETAKLDAIQKNRVTFVEENMKKEQAGIMKLRGTARSFSGSALKLWAKGTGNDLQIT